VGRRNLSAVPNIAGRPEDTITPQQYKVGWDLVSTGHTVQQVLSATGLSRPQLAWLMKVGDESRGMASYQGRIAELSAKIRSRAQDAADAVGSGSVDHLKRAVEIGGVAQTIARNLMAAHLKHRVGPASERIRAGKGTDKDLAQMAMPHSMRETLKALRPFTDFSETARAFRIVFDSPHQGQDPLSQLPKEARLDLSGEALLPAATALVEELVGEDVGHDILDDLLPEFRGWTEEDIEHFAETGERPARDFGDDDPLPLPTAPDDVIDVEPSKETDHEARDPVPPQDPDQP